MWRLNDTAQKSYPPQQAEWNLQLFVPTRNRVGSGYRANNGITPPRGEPRRMHQFMQQTSNTDTSLPTTLTTPEHPEPALASATCRCRLVLPHFQSLQPLKSYLPDLLQALQQQHVPVEVVIVDDGSPRLMQKLLGRWTRRLAEQYPNLLPCILLEQNYGKGFAIRKGWSHAADPIQILAFVDADGSVPASSVAEQLLQSLEHPDQLRCGVRPNPSKETRSLKRRWMGSFFAHFVRTQIGITVSDPQCGFKMAPAPVYRQLKRRFKIDRFAFDCELLAFHAQAGVSIVEQEVPWREAPTSTVKALRDGMQMWKDIRGLKKRLKIYRKPLEF